MMEKEATVTSSGNMDHEGITQKKLYLLIKTLSEVSTLECKPSRSPTTFLT